MSSSYLMNLLASAVAVIVGIVIHESAHAAAAWALGDKTARSRGRVSLNPLNHIDPFGTIILPLLMLAAGGPVFAFAKPVPVYLNNLKHPKRDEVLVSAARIEHRTRVPGGGPHARGIRQPLRQHVLCHGIPNHELRRHLYRCQLVARVL